VSGAELDEVMRRAGQTRVFSSDPVPPETLTRILDAARFAPSGGNHQGWRVVVVADPDRKRALRELYQPVWDAHRERLAQQRLDAASGVTDHSVAPRTEDAADRFVQTMDSVAYLLVVCVDLSALTITDSELDRPSIVGGASVYPFVQNLVLGCHAEGLGVALTTLICRVEPAVIELLDIPAGFAIASLVAVGVIGPGGELRRLSRRPVESFTYLDTFGAPWPVRDEHGG